MADQMTVESPPRSCPGCEAAVAADARFCANCGKALTEASPGDQALHARLIATTPEPLIQKMRAAKLTGELKPVTALFADVVGSTTLAEQMDPEDWATTMDRAVALLTDVVEHYGGWVASHTGDGLMALFGAPTATPDDASNALNAAVAMQRRLLGINLELEAEGLPAVRTELRVRCDGGLAAGTAARGRFDGHRLAIVPPAAPSGAPDPTVPGST